MRKTAIAIAAAILGIGALASLHTSSASAADSGNSASTEVENSLVIGDEQDAAVADIRALDEGRGYYSVLTSFKDQTIVVKWQAPVPDDVAALKRTKLHDFLITDVVSVKFDAATITRASEQIQEATAKDDLPNIVSASGAASGDGLLLTVTPETLKAYDESRLRDLYASTAKKVDDFALGSDFTITIESEEQPQPLDRQDDASTWTAGGMIKTNDFTASGGERLTGDWCSIGFSMVNSSGDGRMLSAGHCNDTDPASWRDGAMDMFADDSDVQHHATDDTLLIDPTGGTRGFVFGGPWNAGPTYTPYRIAVAAESSSYNGDVVCPSGANSGERCGREVINEMTLVYDCIVQAGVTYYCHGWKATHPDTVSVAAVGGDSGGPVYKNRNDGRVQAKGIIQSGNTQLTCPSVRYTNAGGVLACPRYVYFVDIESLLNRWPGWSVETSS